VAGGALIGFFYTATALGGLGAAVGGWAGGPVREELFPLATRPRPATRP
jgi:hypothetical protein